MMTSAKAIVAAAVFAAMSPSYGAAVANRDIQAEEANRAVVLNFYDRCFNKHEPEEAAQVVADAYKQHNPHVPDGKAAFVNHFKSFFKDNPGYAAEIVRSATDGDLVYLHVHARRDAQDRGSAVVDIFRVNDGKIVEHWDVIQPVPANSANQNTMF